VNDTPCILIVDDDPATVRVQRHLLSKAGYTVIDAATGREGLEMVRQHRPDLVLLDVVLPDLSGIEVCRQIKSDPDLKNDFVVLCSGIRNASDDQVEGLETGADGYIVLPIPNREMLARVEAMLRINRAEKRLRETQRLSIKAEEMGNFGYWDRDFVKNRSTWSQGTYRIFGINPDEFEDSYEYFLNLVHPSDRERVKNATAASLYKCQPFDLEYRIIRPDGAERIVHVVAEVRFDESGQATGLFGTTHDITDRKRVDEALIESRNFLEKIIDAIADPVFVKDDQHRWILLNDSYCSFMGYSREELLGKSDDDFFPADEADVFWRKDEETFTSGIENENEEQFTDAKGITHTIITKKSRYVDASGKKYLVGVIRDITQRRRTEDALCKSEERLRLSLEAINDGVWDWNVPTGTAVFSPRWYTMLGYEPYEFPQSYDSFGSLVHPDDIVRVEREIKEYIASGEGYAIEIRMRTKSDGWRWILTRGMVVQRDADGRPVRMVGTHSDITERKRAEEDKEKLEAQLRQAQKLEAIGTLAGGIAHDFNNILGIIIGNTELAAFDLPEHSREKQNIEQALKACARAKGLVQQILVFSRMEGRLERQPVDLGSAIRETLKFLRASLPTTIEIRQNIPEKDLVALADMTQIRQLLTNLCTNAAHAMEETGGILDVSLTEVDVDPDSMPPHSNLKPGRYARLRVGDTGQGMGSWTLERIFDPYFTTKEVGKGSGLGLSVVQGIVTRHEGAITVHSEPGKGSTFDVYLPGIDSEATTEVDVDKLLPSGNERILFVDDEEALADIGQTGLQLLGYEVVTKTSSAEALELFRAQPKRFDLVITDYTMPKMTGADLAVEMMKIRPDIPIILCTGFNERITEEKAREMGIRAFLMKPVTMRDIAGPIRRVLDTEYDPI
jgi:PAS domain S-box-containing protein